MNIDMHAHFVPRECFDAVDNAGRRLGPSTVKDEKGHEQVTFTVQNRAPIAITRQYWDPETRIKDMDAAGVDVQVLSALPPFFYYELETEACLWFSRRQNDGISQVVAEHPTRFVGLATVPLQEPLTALAELDRAINKLGLRGVEIGSNINGRDLDSPELMPLFREMETLDVPVLVHPSRVAGFAGAERLKKYHLATLIGNPMDTTVAGAHLIFGGILERFPRLKVYLAHGGGDLVYLSGRLEQGYHMRPECQVAITRPFSHYLPLFYFDTMVHSRAALEYLIASVGADKVVLGSDYPADMADHQLVSRVQGLTGIPDEDKQRILGGNAACLLKL
ncbi:MAG: amidohydrolase [Chloroflexi bacterium]|nr:amidohydrolase [Chloroflexota bacterium]